MNVVARRSLYCLDEKSKRVELTIFSPQQTEPNGDFRCLVEVRSGSVVLDSSNAIGVDSLAALQMALSMSKTLIKNINQKDYRGRLRWLDDGVTDIGFDEP